MISRSIAALPERIPGWLIQLAPALFVFSLILKWSSGYKNAIVWGALLVLVVQAVRGRRTFRTGGLLVPILGVTLVSFASAWFSVDRAYSLRVFAKFPELLAGYFVLVNVLPGRPRLARTADAFVDAMAGIALLDFGRLIWSGCHGGLAMDNGRWFGSFLGFPTIAAGLYATTVVLAVARLPGEMTPAHRVVKVIELMGFGALLYLLQTRSILLGIALGMIPVLLIAPASRRWKIAALGTAVAAFALVALVPGPFRDRLLAGSGSDRGALWSDAHSVIQRGVEKEPERAWIGFGYGHRMFKKLHLTLPSRLRRAERVYDHTHNASLELRIQSGYLGCLAWAGLLLAAAWRTVRRFPPRDQPELRRVAAGLAGALVCLLIYGQFSVLFALQPVLLLWCLLAALMAACVRAV